jgi:glutamate/tyrosine decarboxylase-like PLP-dependent enzyme
MGAGLYLTRHPDILEKTFRVATGYMPRDAAALDIRDPFAHSMQWSRRFIGLKVFLSLAVAGWDGYAEAIRHQTAMGDLLRRQLAEAGWQIMNHTPLPTVCFVDGSRNEGKSASYLQAIAQGVVTSGQAWISTANIAGTIPVLRACITNYRTGAEDVAVLIHALEQARARVAQT